MRLVVVLLAIASSVAHADDEKPNDLAPEPEEPKQGRPAEKGTFGLGIILGEPTGISAKLYLSDDQAIQIAAGAAFYGGGLQVHGDYVFHPLILQERDSFVLPVYIGPGLRFIQYNPGAGAEVHYAIGLRAVLGLLFDFKSVPLDVFVEVAGVLEYDFTEGIDGAFNLGAGVRYYF